MNPKQAINYLQNLADHGAGELKDAVAALKPLTEKPPVNVFGYGYGTIIDTDEPGPRFQHPNPSIWCGDIIYEGEWISCYLSPNRTQYDYWRCSTIQPFWIPVCQSGWGERRESVLKQCKEWMAVNPIGPKFPCFDKTAIWCGDCDYGDGTTMSCYVGLDRESIDYATCLTSTVTFWIKLREVNPYHHASWRNCAAVVKKWLYDNPPSVHGYEAMTCAAQTTLGLPWTAVFPINTPEEVAVRDAIKFANEKNCAVEFKLVTGEGYSTMTTYHKASPSPKPMRACMIYVIPEELKRWQMWLNDNGYTDRYIFHEPTRNQTTIRIHDKRLPDWCVMPKPGEYFKQACWRVVGNSIWRMDDTANPSIMETA